MQKDRYEISPLVSAPQPRRQSRDKIIGRTVAIKRLSLLWAAPQQKQFLREAQIVGQLSHPPS